MFGKFLEKINKPKEQLSGPREINFENGIKLEISLADAKPDLQFKLTKNGTEIHDFKTDAPEGTKIELSPKNKWEADSDSQTIYVGKYKDADGILSFLHEAGHLHDKVSADLVFTAKRRHAEEMIKDKQNHYPEDRLLAMNKEREIVISAERNAWSFALKKTRQLEKKFDISILKRIGNVDDVIKHVNSFLGTYEQSYLDELYNIDIFTKEEMEKLFAKLDKQSKLEMRS